MPIIFNGRHPAGYRHTRHDYHDRSHTELLNSKNQADCDEFDVEETDDPQRMVKYCE